MMKYAKYKDSGINWLGTKNPIPSHWNLERVKDMGNYRSGDYISALDMDIENSYPVYGGNGFRGLSKDYNHNGDYILIGRQGALCGNINYATGKFWATEHAVVVYKRKMTDIKWLGELLKVMNLNQYSLSAAQPGLSVDRIKRLELPVPPFPEQKAIAQYLDAKTQAIDKKVSLLQKKIDYYTELRVSIINDAVTKGLNKNVELKDSGIDWIGKIPKHWEVKRFKEAIRKYTTGGTPPTSNTSYFDGDNIWVCIGDIDDKNIVDDSKIKLTSEAIKDANIIKTPKGSLLYSFKLSIGKMAFANCDLYTNEAILSIFPNKKIDLMFFYFMLPKYMDLASTENIYGAKMLNQKLIANALLVQPPVKEQTEIAQYLDKKPHTIDAITTNIGKQIEHLTELRKTLINDVVTGKIKVI